MSGVGRAAGLANAADDRWLRELHAALALATDPVEVVHLENQLAVYIESTVRNQRSVPALRCR